MKLSSALAAVALAAAPVCASAWGPNPSFDCAMRKLAYAYGKQVRAAAPCAPAGARVSAMAVRSAGMPAPR